MEPTQDRWADPLGGAGGDASVRRGPPANARLARPERFCVTTNAPRSNSPNWVPRRVVAVVNSTLPLVVSIVEPTGTTVRPAIRTAIVDRGRRTLTMPDTR